MSGATGAPPLPAPAAAPPEAPRRLLLMQLKWMGDVLMTTPTIRAARRAFPRATIDFVTGVEGAAVLEGNPHLDRVIVWKRGFRGGLRAMRDIAAGHYDAVVDFRSTPRDAWFVAASRAEVRIGMRGRGPRNVAYTHLFPKATGPVYMPLQKLRFLTALGVEPGPSPDLALELCPGAAEREWANALLERLGYGGSEPIVALSPVSRITYKRWAPERWAAVGDRIAESGTRVIISSGPGELDQARAVAERMRHQVVYDYGGCNLRQLGALYERCVLWVGNDGGAKHIAVAVGTPTVSVFRYHESPIWTDLTPGSPHRAIERAPVLPCVHPDCGECPHVSCLRQVSVADVEAVVAQALPGSIARSATG